MPATYVSYMADVDAAKFFGMPLSRWMHSANVSLHLINALLLLFLSHRLSMAFGGGARSAAPLAAVAFWALHPLRAEPVAWIACRKEMLWTFFSLAGLISWARSFAPAVRSLSAGPLRLATLLLFAAACISKPTAMCLPFLAGAIHFLLWMGACGDTARFRATRQVLACYAVMLAMAAGTAAAAAYSQTHVAGQEAIALFAAPWHHRVVHALSALGFYVRATLWPAGLHVDCRIVDGIVPLGGVANLAALAGAVVVVAVVAVRLRVWRMSRATAVVWFSFAWFIVPLVPTLGLLGSFGIEAHADRFTYLPAMSFAFFAALAPASGIASRFAAQGRARTAAWMAVAVYAVLAVRQTGFWRDDHTAHLRALDCDPSHPRAMVHVGDALCAKGRFDKGIDHYRRSMALRPREYVKYRLAYALASRGSWDDYQEVKRLGAPVAANPSLDSRGMMLDALGTACMVDGDWDRAARFFEFSLAAPGRFWPKASTKRKIEECLERMK